MLASSSAPPEETLLSPSLDVQKRRQTELLKEKMKELHLDVDENAIDRENHRHEARVQESVEQKKIDGVARNLDEGIGVSNAEFTAYNYCTENWCIRDATESLFSYEAGKTVQNFENCDGSYVASLETDVENAPQCLKDFCDLDTDSIIDGLTLMGKGATEEYLLNDSVSNNTCTPSPSPKLCYFSCADALETTCDSSAGLYSICPSYGENESFTAFCDQETSGGGWMLLYSYNHDAGDNAELVPGVIPQNPEDDYSHFFVNNIRDTIKTKEAYASIARRPLISVWFTSQMIIRL
jgi:hypothetical protein